MPSEQATEQSRAAATLTVMSWTMLGKLAGVIRDTLIGAYFGAGVLGDAYAAAQAVPQAINSLLSQGLSSVTVPYFHEDREDAPRLTSALTRFILAVHVPLTLVLGLVAPLYLPVVFRGLTPKGAQMAAELSWLFALMLIPLDLAAVWTGRLNAERKFGRLSSANLVRSLTNVVVLVLLHHFGLISTGVAFVLGATFALLSMWPAVRPFRTPTPETWRRTWQAIRLMPSQVTSGVVGQINFLVDQAFASSVATGGLLELTFGGRFLELPVSLFGSSLATVLFPDFAQHAQNQDREGLIRSVDRALYLTWVATLPIAFLLIGFAVPATKVVFGYGRFGHAAVLATAAIVAAYAGSLIFRTMQAFIARAFYAEKNTAVLARTSVVFIALNALFDYLLIRVMGAPGIALGTTIDAALYFSVTTYQLERMLVGRHAISLRPYLWSLVAAVPLAPLSLFMSRIGFVSGRLMQFGLVVVGSLLLLGLYLLLLRWLGGAKARYALNLLGRVMRSPGRRISAMRR